MNEVAVVGGGPTGLVLAAELALAGVDAVILERRPTPELAGTRARGFHARTIEILDQRGVADRFLAAGRTAQVMSFAGTPLDVAALPTRHPYTLALSQSGVEDVLRGWVEELGVTTRHGAEVTGVTQDARGVDVDLAHGDPLRVGYLVGADGGRSTVRRSVGIELVGAEATRSHLIAEAVLTDEAPTGLRQDAIGIHGINPVGDGGSVGIVVTEAAVGPATEPTLADLSAALTLVYGTDFGVHDASWISRFTDAARQASTYRSGRVLLAGDAAHTHPPTGGQGIGLGVQDAVNLGWKLALVVTGRSPASLLDSYEAERHPATARVLKNVMTQAFLQRGDARTDAIRDTFAEVLTDAGPRERLAGLLTGLDVALDLGEGHPLLGRRVPDLDLATADGPRRVFELLHDARPLLLDLEVPEGAAPAAPGGTGDASWGGRVRHVRARCEGPWVLPVVGPVVAPTGVLVRPDGHVAWVGEGTTAGLEDALTTWFGSASAAASAPGSGGAVGGDRFTG
ncbi:FAD-dependent monooxygenase [Intrasporangium flavum]|uniref:FAD-dependent monooxygenase n=1 Tax=Intrasporangium flavum TaxID=1428657 RepID=UPI00096D5130|nr:FAD-dependent monooxygenase [Intrasporangium flavum]